jgi:hypothetical protein
MSSTLVRNTAPAGFCAARWLIKIQNTKRILSSLAEKPATTRVELSDWPLLQRLTTRDPRPRWYGESLFFKFFKVQQYAESLVNFVFPIEKTKALTMPNDDPYSPCERYPCFPQGLRARTEKFLYSVLRRARFVLSRGTSGRCPRFAIWARMSVLAGVCTDI